MAGIARRHSKKCASRDGRQMRLQRRLGSERVHRPRPPEDPQNVPHAGRGALVAHHRRTQRPDRRAPRPYVAHRPPSRPRMARRRPQWRDPQPIRRRVQAERAPRLRRSPTAPGAPGGRRAQTRRHRRPRHTRPDRPVASRRPRRQLDPEHADAVAGDLPACGRPRDRRGEPDRRRRAPRRPTAAATGSRHPTKPDDCSTRSTTTARYGQPPSTPGYAAANSKRCDGRTSTSPAA